jgi:energy-coupling factor transporter ATP-binding protein EcfA2
MILRRLRVEQFRQHNFPVEIVFDDRLTVVSGLNEAGKSTLFTALQYAFFRRSSATGKDVDSLAPWNTKGLCSTVIVEFEQERAEYRLEKVWGKRGSTKLLRRDASGHFAPFMEQDADEFLANVFSGQVQRAGTFTGFNAQQMGLAYLLFVPQAAIPIASDAKQSALNTDAQSRLTEIVGAAAQSPKEAQITKSIVAAHEQLFKQNGERRKGRNITSAADDIVRVEASILKTRDALEAFLTLADRVEEAEALCASSVRASAEARAAEDAALPRYQLALELKAAHAAASAAYEKANATYTVLLAQARRFETATERMTALEPARTELTNVVTQSRALSERSALSRGTAVDMLTAANAPDTELTRLESELTLARKIAAQRSRVAELTKCIDSVEAVDDRLTQIDVRLSELGGGTDADVAELARAVDTQRDLRTRRDAALTSVVVAADSAITLRWSAGGETGDASLAAGQQFERRSSGELVFALPGVASFAICGPVTDAADLETCLGEAERRLTALSTRLGTDSALALQQRILERTHLLEERRTKLADRANHLGGKELVALRVEIEELTSALASAKTDDSIDALEQDITRRKTERATMIDRRASLVADAIDAEKQAATALRDALAAVQATDVEYERLRAELASLANDFATNDLRRAALHKAYDDRYQAERCVDAAAIAYAPYENDGDPLARYSTCQSEARARAREEQDAKVALQQVLDRLAEGFATAPEAALCDLQEELDGLQVRYEEEQLNDKALRMLYAFVEETNGRREALFAKPVLERVAPWFEELTGKKLGGLDLGAHNDLDTLTLTGVDRPVRFEELSTGTADQLALLIRLAFASLLTSPERLGRMPVVFDDPLVNADSERRSRFKRIFEDVSQGAQIIVFTCRPEDYVDLAGSAVALRSGGSVASLPSEAA